MTKDELNLRIIEHEMEMTRLRIAMWKDVRRGAMGMMAVCGAALLLMLLAVLN